MGRGSKVYAKRYKMRIYYEVWLGGRDYNLWDREDRGSFFPGLNFYP